MMSRMRKLPPEKRAAILSCLVEGVGINATARLNGASKLTVLRLLADAGTFADDYHTVYVRNLQSRRIELDELWSFCGCKAKSKENGAQGHGDVWTWTATDPDSKLIVGYFVGDRDAEAAQVFTLDVANRLANRVQVTSDGFSVYPWAVAHAFGRDDVDYARLVKEYSAVSAGAGRYSPPQCTGCKRKPTFGNPEESLISTSIAERNNLMVRTTCRRFTRLTNGFSKRFENHAFAVALGFFAFNFIKKHGTIKTTPAVAAGIASAPLSMLDFVAMLEAEEAKVGGRLTDYQPARPGAPESE